MSVAARAEPHALSDAEIVRDYLTASMIPDPDAAAVFMTLVSVTGLSLIFFLAKWRRSGLILLGAGTVLSYVLYLIFVP